MSVWGRYNIRGTDDEVIKARGKKRGLANICGGGG